MNLDGPNTLVPKDHVSMSAMLVCAAETGVSNLDENFIMSDFPGGGGLDNLARF